jgi:hypothetical protein
VQEVIEIPLSDLRAVEFTDFDGGAIGAIEMVAVVPALCAHAPMSFDESRSVLAMEEIMSIPLINACAPSVKQFDDGRSVDGMETAFNQVLGDEISTRVLLHIRWAVFTMENAKGGGIETVVASDLVAIGSGFAKTLRDGTRVFFTQPLDSSCLVEASTASKDYAERVFAVVDWGHRWHPPTIVANAKAKACFLTF